MVLNQNQVNNINVLNFAIETHRYKKFSFFFFFKTDKHVFVYTVTKEDFVVIEPVGKINIIKITFLFSANFLPNTKKILKLKKKK